jgi:hypothetical protein
MPDAALTATTPVASDTISTVTSGAVAAPMHDLSVLGLFMNADMIVKSVMILLIFYVDLVLDDYYFKTHST